MSGVRNDDYQDIIHLPHPEPRSHPRMSMEKRAAQFSPFAALTGYESAIEETHRLTNRRVELSESEKENLDFALSEIQRDLIATNDEGLRYGTGDLDITVIYFVSDSKKDGGEYVTISGTVRKLDGYRRVLLLEDGTEIPIDDIYRIDY